MFLREFDLPFSMKIWDSLFAIEENFPFYILYVSESILSIFSNKLLSFDSFSGNLLFIILFIHFIISFRCFIHLRFN